MENQIETKVVRPVQIETPEEAIEAIMSSVPDDKKEFAACALSIIKEESFSGPIPHPRSFKEYEAVLPGSADRILKMAEDQQKHRMELEKTAIKKQLTQSGRGQIFGFIVFLLGMLLSVVFAQLEMKTFAGIFASTTLVLLVTLFVTGKKASNKDLESKREPNKE